MFYFGLLMRLLLKLRKGSEPVGVFVFYINKVGEYYKVAVSADNVEKVRDYLETISKEVRYKGVETVKKVANKVIPCGILRQFSYYGNRPPKGTTLDRRHHKL